MSPDSGGSDAVRSLPLKVPRRIAAFGIRFNHSLFHALLMFPASGVMPLPKLLPGPANRHDTGASSNGGMPGVYLAPECCPYS